MPADGSCKSQAIARDSTRLLVQWEQGNCFAALSGKPAQLQFTLQVRTRRPRQTETEWALILWRCGQGAGSRLYSFWLANSTDGHSGGFVAGGGPEFTGMRDLDA